MKRLVQPGTVRVPSGRVLISGAVLPGAVEVEITNNNHYQADRFKLKIALNAPGGHDLKWWGADERKENTLFDARISLNGTEHSLIIGEADKIDAHPETGEIEIEGRDLSARLIDNKLQEAMQNLTASEVAIKLAKRRGLTPIVTATDTKVSRYYSSDHDRVSHDQFNKSGTEWDLLKFLAENEGFDLYVKGTELHFETAVDSSKAEPYAVKWDSDAKKSDVRNIRLGRSLTLAKDVIVVVRSWHSGHGRGFSKHSHKHSRKPSSQDVGFSKTSGAAGNARAGVNKGTAQRFVFVRPNLTEDQAQKLADSLRADITKHERTLSFECPGELDLTIRDMLAVSGCGGWDQRYFINEITRRVSFDGGFVQNVSAKNHFTESQVGSA